MSIKVTFDNRDDSDPVFPGSTLRGTVHYTISKQRTIHQATISLTGTIRNEYIPVQQNSPGLVLVQGPKRPSKEKIELYNQSIELFKGPYDISPRTFDWPFEFAIPPVCSREGVNDSTSGNLLGDGQVEVELPPSYEWRDPGLGRDVSTVISYILCVHVQAGGLFGNDDKEIPITIRQRGSDNPSLELKATPNEFRPGVSWSSDKLRPQERKLSLKQRFKAPFSGDPSLKPPTLAFKAFVHVARTLSMHQRFNIMFSVHHERTGDSDPSAPTLILDSMQLTLKSHTTVAIARKGVLHSDDMLCQGDKRLADYAVKLANQEALSLSGELMIVADNLCIGEWPKSKDSEVIGDFQTWVVKLQHKLAVQVVVKHVETGKVFPLSAQFPLVILNDAWQMAAPDNNGKPGHTVDQELPAYEDDIQPPSLARKELL